MIEFENVSFEYEKGTPTLTDVSFKIEPGECVGLIGANGSGKSTLMKIMLGLLAYKGNVTVCGMPVDKKNLAEVRKKLGFVLQDSDSQMFMPTIFEDMMFGPMNYGLSKEDAEKKVDEILERLGITELKHKYNHKISGGQKRMAAIATIMAMEPEAVIMDEPTVALDPYNRRLVMNTIRDMDNTKLIASHDLDMIYDLCDRVMLIAEGKLIADGEATAILIDKELLEANRLELPIALAKGQYN